MKQTYRDLAEFKLPLVDPQAPSFSSLVREIEQHPQPFASREFGDLDTAAVLLNQSGKAIITLAYIWRYTTAAGRKRTRRYSNLGSSRQMEVLSGRAQVELDLGSFLLPGSKRLITERGMFGNNLDVLPPDFAGRAGGYVGGGGGQSFREESGEEIAEIELCLDAAIFEDGLCVGPDESGLFENVITDLERQRDTAREIVTALRNGASEGQIFEILRPVARRTSSSAHGIGHRIGERRGNSSPLLVMFANQAIHRLVNTDSSELLPWFEHIAEPPRIQLRRP